MFARDRWEVHRIEASLNPGQNIYIESHNIHLMRLDGVEERYVITFYSGVRIELYRANRWWVLQWIIAYVISKCCQLIIILGLIACCILLFVRLDLLIPVGVAAGVAVIVLVLLELCPIPFLQRIRYHPVPPNNVGVIPELPIGDVLDDHASTTIANNPFMVENFPL